MLFIDVPSAGGGDIGGGGTWNGLVGSVPCLCPYMIPLDVGVELRVDCVVCGFVWGGDMEVGLVVRDFGGGGRGGPEFDVGMGGRGLAGGRAWGGNAKLRFEDLGSVGEAPGETGDSGPLAVFALLLEPPEEGAESKFGLFGTAELFIDE